jgi:small-conductance mechanosensitive channel
MVRFRILSMAILFSVALACWGVPSLHAAAQESAPDQEVAPAQEAAPAETGEQGEGDSNGEKADAPAPPPPEAAAPLADADLAGTGLSALPPLLADESTFSEALELVQARVAEVQAHLTELTEAEEPVQAEIDRSQNRLDRIRSLELVIQRRITMRERLREAEAAMANHLERRQQYEESGLEQEPPYTISFFDRVLDERKVALRDLNANRVSLSAVAGSIRTAEADYANAQRTRRTARDNAEQALQEPARSEALYALEMARLEEFTASQRIEALRMQQTHGELQEELLECRESVLSRIISDIEPRVTFTAETLEERRAEIATRRDSLEKQLKELSRSRDANESLLYKAREARQQAQELAAAAGEEAPRGGDYQALQARETWLEASSLGVEYVQQRLANLVVEQQLWEQRYALAHPDEMETEPSAWLRDARQHLTRVEGERQQVEARLTSLRGTQLDLQNQLAGPAETMGDRESIESRMRAIEQLEQRAREYQASLVNLGDLTGRLVEQLEVRATPRSLGDFYALGMVYVQQFWAYELYIFDDRAFTVGRVFVAAIVFFAVILAVWFAQRVLRRRVLSHLLLDASGPKANMLRDLIVALIRNTSSLFLLVLAMNASAASLPFRNALHEWLHVLLIAGFWWQIGLWAAASLARMIERNRTRRAVDDPSSVSAYGIVSILGRAAIWALIVVIVLYEFDYPITGLLAGLGVGGIAVAFALQNILADVFNSVAILLDKPFRVGDFVILGDTKGTVEQIGIKTTRVRSISGEQVVLSNTDLLGSRIHNYKRMVERRIAFQIGVVYQTPADKLEQIPAMVRDIIEDTSKTRFDRGHFMAFGAFSLDFEFVYFVLGADYALFMDIQQEINLAIYRKFEEEGIVFAYPTQELHLRHLNAAVHLESPPLQPATEETSDSEEAAT